MIDSWSELSNELKSPMLNCAKALLTTVNDSENCRVIEEPTGIINTVAAIALPAIALLGTFFTLPLWLAGELIEVLVGLENDSLDQEVELPNLNMSDDELALSSNTKYLGFPISTYQYTSDENFCGKNSDWGKYNKEHFIDEKGKEHLRFGQGVDILTDEGMQTLCDDTLRAHGNSLRFSVEWADVLNSDGSFNDVAMQRYVNAAKYIDSRGIKPIVVLHHFVTPIDENGKNVFESKKSVDQFVSYAKYVYEKMHDHVDTFLTFNEPKVQTVQNYFMGMFPAGSMVNLAKCQMSTRNMLEAHAKAYKAIHELAGENKVVVGLTHQALKFVTSSRWNILARVTSFVMTHLFHDSFMDWAEKNKESIDLLGVQYYARPLIAGYVPMPAHEKGGKMAGSMPFRFDPSGIGPVLRDVNKRLGGDIELFVSETGTTGRNYVKATNDVEKKALQEMDQSRKEYFIKSVRVVAGLQDEGLPITGYMPWALRINGEWNHGFSKDHDFGMIAYDPDTKEERDTEGFKTISKNL